MIPNPFGHLPTPDADGAIARGVRRVAHLDIPGGAQVLVQGGYAYVAHMSPPDGTTVIDVHDPAKPKVVARITLPDASTHTHKVAVKDGLMLVNSQRNRRKFFKKGEALAKLDDGSRSESDLAVALGIKETDVAVLREAVQTGYDLGGYRIYDIADPAKPREIAFRRTGGFGVHGVDFDGRYAFVSTEMDGFRGNILVIDDLADPAKPQEVARWWLPGQKAGEAGDGGTGGRQLHHGLRCGDRFWGACWQAGIRVLDVADPAAPREIGAYNYHPPFPEPTHTVMAIGKKHQGRDLALAIDESHDPHPVGRSRGALWVFDVADPAAMQPISLFELGEMDSPWSRVGRFGAGQIVERDTGDHVYSTWFAGGLRVVDIADPTAPNEIAFYIPPPPPGFDAPESMDVELDGRGVVFLLDRRRGLDILETTV